MNAVDCVHEVEVDLNLIRQFEKNGPRYTSYPTADRFVEAFDGDAYASWCARRSIGGFVRPLSIYVHIPFCRSVCYYCACNKVITKDPGKAEVYLKFLFREIELQAGLLDAPKVEQLHLGGGSPTYLTPTQLKILLDKLHTHFNLTSNADLSIEIDPRTVDHEIVAEIIEMGFSRINLGVQDFDPQVQLAINRVQSREQTLEALDSARAHGAKSIGVDLIYGLPRQNLISFNQTLQQIIQARPDRIAVFNYAHLPNRFKPQRRINELDLPEANTRLELMKLAVRKLCEAGYVYIGMDHFALPEDELAIAQRRGLLQRNFQGYSTHADCDLLGLGVSAIGKMGPTYSQNFRDLDSYYDALKQDRLPIMRGMEMSADDLLRRAVIHALMCHFAVSMQSISLAHLIDFHDYFKREMESLAELQQAGLVIVDEDWISATPRGRLLIRTIAMVFDKHLRQDADRQRYSKVI